MDLTGKRVKRKPRSSNWANYWGDGKNYEWGRIVIDDGDTLHIAPGGVNTGKYWRLAKDMLIANQAFVYLDFFKGYKNKRRCL